MTTRLLLIASLLSLIACGGEGPGTDAGQPGDAGADATVVPCASHRDCEDDSYCNGTERCEPGSPTANSRGCVPGMDPCAAGDTCDDTRDLCVPPACVVPDRDGDGQSAMACGGGDCDDDDPDRFPGNPEACDPDAHDEDCNPATLGGIDLDGDGHEAASCCNGARCGPDCDDSRRSVHPDATEACNAIDDDCDGAVDEAGAFCPTGICIDRRCRAPNWEWSYGSDGFDYPFGLDVDSAGNVYLGVGLSGAGADVNGDGVPEPRGDYLVSLAPEGFPRWFVPVPSGVTVWGSLAVSADESTIALPTRSEIRFFRTSDGEPAGTIAIAPFDRWEEVRIIDAAPFRDELIVAANAVITDGATSDVLESAIVLVRYSYARSELGRRVIELPTGQRAAVSHIDTSHNYLAVLGASSVPLDVGPVPTTGGFLAVLRPDLTTQWAREVEHMIPLGPISDTGHVNRVAVSDSGHAAAVGAFSGTWTPSWTSTTYTSVSTDAFAVSFDTDGTHLWTRVHSGPSSDSFFGADYDGRDGLFVSGHFSGTMTVPPRGNIGPAAGGCDAFFALLGIADGFARDARAITGTNCEAVRNVRVDRFGGMLVLGDFYGTVTLPSGTSYSSRTTNVQDVFLIRIADL